MVLVGKSSQVRIKMPAEADPNLVFAFPVHGIDPSLFIF